jgi:hypothetical protein
MTRSASKKTRKTDTASVVPAKYRQHYQDGSCGDRLAVRLRRHLETADGTIDLDKLRALAVANAVWTDRYASLNPGMQRLCIGNRLRALARKGGKLKWGRER